MIEAFLFEMFMQQHGDGKGLFAGGAARHPNSDGIAFGLFGHQVGDGFFLERQEGKRVKGGASEATAEGKRFSSRGLRTHRNKLGLSAAEYAGLVGVSAQTIYNWERETSRPRVEQAAAIAALRSLCLALSAKGHRRSR